MPDIDGHKEEKQNYHDFQDIIDQSGFGIHGRSGWLFILWGSMWLALFLIFQFGESLNKNFLPILIAGGILLSIVLTLRMFRVTLLKKRESLTSSFVFSLVGYAFFVAMSISLFDIDSRREIVILLLLALSLACFQIGLNVNRRISLLGVLLILFAGLFNYLLPNFFYLATGISGLFIFYSIGLSALLQK